MKDVLSPYSKDQIKKASSVKAIFFDVDGVLTDGRIIYNDNGSEVKEFNVKDGLIIPFLKRLGIITGAISGRESSAVARRCAELKLDFCHQGIINKRETFEKLVKFHKLKKSSVAFIGDDLNDLTTLEVAGFSICPADAPVYLRKKVDLVTMTKGGAGVLREVGDLVLAARGELDRMIKKL